MGVGGTEEGSCQSLPPPQGLEEIAKGISAGLSRMKVVCEAPLGVRNEGTESQARPGFERVNARFEVRVWASRF